MRNAIYYIADSFSGDLITSKVYKSKSHAEADLLAYCERFLLISADACHIGHIECDTLDEYVYLVETDNFCEYNDPYYTHMTVVITDTLDDAKKSWAWRSATNSTNKLETCETFDNNGCIYITYVDDKNRSQETVYIKKLPIV